MAAHEQENNEENMATSDEKCSQMIPSYDMHHAVASSNGSGSVEKKMSTLRGSRGTAKRVVPLLGNSNDNQTVELYDHHFQRPHNPATGGQGPQKMGKYRIMLSSRLSTEGDAVNTSRFCVFSHEWGKD